MLPVVVIGPSEARSLVEIDKINGDETYMDVEITKVSLSLMRIRDKGSLRGDDRSRVGFLGNVGLV